MKLKLLANLGDDWPRDKDGNYYQQDQVYDFDEVIAAKLMRAGLAEAPTAKVVAGHPSMHLAEESPVSQENAREAVAAISTMRSKDKLQHIVDNDTRDSVKDAARKRLAEIG
jgi:hypothetical protein